VQMCKSLIRHSSDEKGLAAYLPTGWQQAVQE
jgi:hypothetical protein